VAELRFGGALVAGFAAYLLTRVQALESDVAKLKNRLGQQAKL
jgi:hypothetical protein